MLSAINELLWGPGTLALVLGTGLFLTIRTRFLPWRNLGFALRSALGREARQGNGAGVSPFSSLTTALAATIGTGNIVGVSTALVAGGPGALVWMEITALVGMSTAFAESLLAVKYRQKNERGDWVGGPMYVMKKRLGPRGGLLGAAFALAAAATSIGIGSMAQANAIAEALHSVFDLPAGKVGLATAILALTVILGGVRSIARVSATLVPLMSILFLGAALTVILGNFSQLPAAVGEMLRCALSPQAAAGGTLGSVIRWGVARGVFSNEAGMGSAAISAASAGTDSPVRQGYIHMTAVFFDTTVICTVTGLAICCSGVLGTVDASGAPVNGAALTILAFETILGPLGSVFLSVSIVLFAFSTILGWEYQGERAFEYLTKSRWLPAYRIIYALSAWWGAAAQLETVFHLADICNALMCFPNLICLLLLSGTVAREAVNFRKNL